MTLDSILQSISAFMTKTGGNLIVAVIVFLVGLVVIKIALSFLGKVLKKSKLDATLHAFIKSVTKIVLLVLLFISCADLLGLPAQSFLTALGAVGLAFSLAVKDSLANLASGVLILFTKPFVLHDFVELDGVSGMVHEIGLVNTVLHTADNKTVMIPNSQITTTKIINYSTAGTRRLDLVFSIGYKDDIAFVRELILNCIESSGFALDEPAPSVVVSEHGASSIHLTAIIWAESANILPLKFFLLEEVKKQFDQNGIGIPYNQLDLHIVRKPTDRKAD